MRLEGQPVLVTGAGSGLGRAVAKRLVEQGAVVTLLDLEASSGGDTAADLGAHARFVAADVTNEAEVRAALDVAGGVRAVVHCAGRGGPLRILDRAGAAAPLQNYVDVINVNLVGTFNVLRLAAERMALNEPLDGDRGVCVLTASVAAYEGQIGQIPYASSKAGVVGMTIVAARDLASRGIRVCTIAPGTFDTPLLAKVPDDARATLASSVPHPSRLGDPEEFAALAQHIIENGMLNGETIRLDGALRMAPR